MKKKFFNHCFFVIFSLFMALPTLVAISNDVWAVGLNGACTVGSTDCDQGLYCDPSAAKTDPGTKKMTSVCVKDASLSVIHADAEKSNNNAFVTTICNVLRIVTGNGGKAFAAFAIISIGIGFFTGKVSWGLMIGVACGIAAMFGAPTIVSAISGSDSYRCIDQ